MHRLGALQQVMVKYFVLERLMPVEFIAAEHYWSEHIDLIEEMYSKYGEELVVVLEDYVLYYEKAIVQSYSKMETSKLIGAVQVYCYNTSIPLILQRAVEIKARWSTEVLLKRNLLKGLGVNKDTHFQ